MIRSSIKQHQSSLLIACECSTPDAPEAQHGNFCYMTDMTGWFWWFNLGNDSSTFEHIGNALQELMLFLKQQMAQQSLREESLNDEENGTRCHRSFLVDLEISAVHCRWAQTSLRYECGANDAIVRGTKTVKLHESHSGWFGLMSEKGLKRDKSCACFEIYPAICASIWSWAKSINPPKRRIISRFSTTRTKNQSSLQPTWTLLAATVLEGYNLKT